MAKKKNNRKQPIPNYLRARMFRNRKKLREERQRQLNNNDLSITNYGENNSSTFNEASSLKIKLRDWANSFFVSKRAIDGLLTILNSYGIDSLPKNHRTLLATPINIEYSDIAGGTIWYNGLQKCLIQIFSTLDRDISISLNFNIDGLPLYNSSKISFWPILASIHGMYVMCWKVIVIKHRLYFRATAYYSNEYRYMVWLYKTKCFK